MAASDKGHLDVVKTLIEAGATCNVNHTNKVGKIYMYALLLYMYTLSSYITGLYTHVYMYVIMMPWVQMQVLKYVRALVSHGYMGLTLHVKVTMQIGRMLCGTKMINCCRMEKQLWA